MKQTDAAQAANSCELKSITMGKIKISKPSKRIGISLDEAKGKAYPDGGGKYLIQGEHYKVHCDEYHMHSFKCLSKC